jgi:hypothetical protein
MLELTPECFGEQAGQSLTELRQLWTSVEAVFSEEMRASLENFSLEGVLAVAFGGPDYVRSGVKTRGGLFTGETT